MFYLYTVLIAAFFNGLLFYLVNFALIPYRDNGDLDTKNVIVVSIVACLAIMSNFAVVHLIIDKLFFRRFYEKPKTFLAYRRGILLGILFSGFAWLQILDLKQWHIRLLFVFLVILIEILLDFWVGAGKSRDGSSLDREDSLKKNAEVEINQKEEIAIETERFDYNKQADDVIKSNKKSNKIKRIGSMFKFLRSRKKR